MITIEDALQLALDAHRGQKDLDGMPVVLHPLTVGLAGRNREEMIAGFLHDVVEDTTLTFDDLRRAGVDEPIIEVLQLLTHDKDALPYEDYVRRIAASGNETAIHVKYNDLTHNLMRGRKGNHQRQVSKHEAAMAIIAPLVN